MSEKEGNSRRLALVCVDEKTVLRMCKAGEHHYRVRTGVPDNAQMMGVQWSFEKQAFVICFKHQSFGIVPMGCKLPYFNGIIVIDLRSQQRMDNLEDRSKELPLWKCHKEVRAFRITCVQTVNERCFISGGSLQVDVSPEYLEKHKPEIGGYYVLYQDGYESYSPAEAFEAGYTLIEGGPQAG